MKKEQGYFVFFLILFAAVVILSPETVRAAGKKTVTCSVKDGVLVISGKGDMPSDLKYGDKNKINKIVVEKGVRSLPIGAFASLKKVKEVEIAATVKRIGEGALPGGASLKKITMPGSFRFVTNEGDEARYELVWDMKGSRIDTISFNTPLDLETLTYISSNNLVVSEKDKKYKSIDGVIYSKDGKSIVRVPAYRETLTVEEGCEEFCTQAVTYGCMDWESDVDRMCFVEKIVLPSSVRTVNTTKYFVLADADSLVEEIVINTKQLGSESILSLLNKFPSLQNDRNFAKFIGQFDSVWERDGMYINDKDRCLLLYRGNLEEVIIPGDVENIATNAFHHNKELRRVVIPDTVKTIREGAFWSCKKLKEVTLPKGLKEIPANLFRNCSALKPVEIPGTVTKIGQYAFCGVKWKKLKLPETVKQVEKGAFATPTLMQVTICGNTAQIHRSAFSYWGNEKKVTLSYRKGIKQWQTDVYVRTRTSGKVKLEWLHVSGADGYQIEISPKPSFQKKLTYDVKKGKDELKLTGLKMKAKYVRIRPYQVVNGKKVYGRWAKTNQGLS